MANEIRKFRAGLAQNDRNQAAYKILIWEIIIWSIVGAIAIGGHFDSDRVALISFCALALFLIVGINIPDLQIIVFLFFALGWASPFIVIGAYLDRFFYVIAFFSFLMSFLVHYWGITYLKDLTRSDND